MRKENAFDRMLGFFSPRMAFQRTRYRVAASMLRKYEGADRGRRTKNWKANSTSANSEIDQSLVVLRNRARQLVRDNPYASKGMQVITSNVVGRGIFTDVKVDSGQKNASGKNAQADKKMKEITSVWRAWAGTREVDFDGRNDFYGLQRLVMRSVAESGEVLVRLRRTGRRMAWSPEGVEVEVPPIQLQVLESDFLDMSALATSDVLTGNIVLNGIEFDKNGKRIAYHLFEEHPGNSFSGIGASLKNQFKKVRVPANEILHIYRLDRAGQIRGVPWLAPVMLRLKDFDEYEDAQLVRQKIAACFAVFVKDMDGVDAALTEVNGELRDKVEPGIIEILPAGKDIELASPPPVEGYGEYSGTLLHSVAAGLGITYESLTNNLSQVNFSSARMGFLEMNRNIQEWRSGIMELQFLNPSFDWFLEGMDLLGFDTSRTRPVYTPPRREMVNPKEEVEAQKNAIRSGFMSLSDAVRNAGLDPKQHFEEMQADNKRLDELGLVLDTDPRVDVKKAAASANPSAPGKPAAPAEEPEEEPANPPEPKQPD